MQLFAVFKEGNYRQECGGIFDDADKAIAAAKQLADGDMDSYHSYEVRPFSLNEITIQTTGIWFITANGRPYRGEKGDLVEDSPIFTCRNQN